MDVDASTDEAHNIQVGGAARTRGDDQRTSE